MLSPELQQQWHVDRNMHLGSIKIRPIKIRPQSGIKAVWQCSKCPAEQPHVWKAVVASRTQGTQCPYCLNRRVCLHNSLATIAPDVAQYWNHSKNKQTPEQMLAGSSFRAEWKCPTCSWEWAAPIADRVRNRAGCPKCSQALKITQPQPTFAEAQPAQLADWDYERNDADGFHPANLTLSSGKHVHWMCSRCPRGQPHRWTASPNNRIGAGSRCPVCAGQQACVCNSLESLAPSFASEFDVDKNGFAASEIAAQSNKLVWWRNAVRGSWKQAVYARTYQYLSRTQKV